MMHEWMIGYEVYKVSPYGWMSYVGTYMYAPTWAIGEYKCFKALVSPSMFYSLR